MIQGGTISPAHRGSNSSPNANKQSGSNIASSSHVRKPSLLEDTRGAALTEYVVLVGAVGVIVAAAVAVAGVDMIHRFEIARFILLMPAP
jgi:Flp pilus assembly pilin Flp